MFSRRCVGYTVCNMYCLSRLFGRSHVATIILPQASHWNNHGFNMMIIDTVSRILRPMSPFTDPHHPSDLRRSLNSRLHQSQHKHHSP
ncbi:hypothetical protein PTI98_007337 [Pleurotus ostreatus]|nr:hypothetical protein PTI98_007337 [Pleurotus ostreatus]